MKLIALDDGHSPDTPGKRTPDGIKENQFNAPSVNYLSIALRRCGFNTTLVAPEDIDIPLETRVKRANDAKADLYVSIHYNAYKGNWDEIEGGVETHYHPKSVNGKKAAGLIQKYVSQGTKQINRGTKGSDFYVLRETNMPAVLVECGFMDVRKEAALMLDPAFQKETAEQICQGVCEYFNVKYVAEAEPVNNLHMLEFTPDHRFVIDKGIPGKLETVSAIANSRDALAGINFGFFDMSGKSEHYSLLMTDGKIHNPPNKVMECWLTRNNKLVVADISTNAQVPMDAQWAAGLSFSLVIDGKKDIRGTELFPHYKQDEPRTAIGQKANGNIVLVVADLPGMTANELADEMLKLGCVTAINCDGGGSSTMVHNGKVINQPEHGRERAVGTVLLVFPPILPKKDSITITINAPGKKVRLDGTTLFID